MDKLCGDRLHGVVGVGEGWQVVDDKRRLRLDGRVVPRQGGQDAVLQVADDDRVVVDCAPLDGFAHALAVEAARL